MHLRLRTHWRSDHSAQAGASSSTLSKTLVSTSSMTGQPRSKVINSSVRHFTCALPRAAAKQSRSATLFVAVLPALHHDLAREIDGKFHVVARHQAQRLAHWLRDGDLALDRHRGWHG
jgi:hypothetical protein